MNLFRASLLALLVAAGAADAQTLRIGINSDPDALDPTASRTLAARQVFASMCDKLIDIDESLNLVPQLATKWEWSNGDKTLNVILRQGVRFHDGSPLDGEAVAASLKRHLTLQGSTRKAEMGPIESIEAAGPLEVKINLSRPFAPLVAALADRAGMILSAKAAALPTEEFAKSPVCAGPFKFVRRIPQDRIELEKFADYWNASAIHVDRVVFLPIPDAAVRAVNLRSGSLEIVEGVSPTDIATLKGDARVKIFTKPSLASAYLAFNVANGPRAQTPVGTKQAVREAIDLAIDRKVLNQVAFDGVYTPGNQSVAPGTPFYIKSLPVPDANPEKARALLKEAGIDRVKVQMTVPNTTDFKQASEVIQAMAREVGIDMELVQVETATMLKQWTDGAFESLIILWSGRIDDDENLYNFNACGQALNGGKYCNQELDKLLNEARGVSDMATRLKHYEAAAKIYLTERPYIYLWNPSLVVGASSKVEGFRLVPDGLLRLQGFKLKS